MNTPSRRRPASFALLFYYVLLFLSTASAYRKPYPLFAWVLKGAPARAAVVLDCLVLVHIVAGIARAQRLTWYLILAYNAVQMGSVAVGLGVWPLPVLAADLGFPQGAEPLRTALLVSGLTMAVVTAYAVHRRTAFWDPDPFLF